MMCATEDIIQSVEISRVLLTGDLRGTFLNTVFEFGGV